MSVVLDTSALIRFFTNDIPPKALTVKKLVESSEEVIIPDVVLPELEYVLLGKTYNSTRSDVSKAFYFLLSKKNVKVSPVVKKAIVLYTSSKLDIADCIIAISATNKKLLSFDKGLLSTKGVNKY